MNNGLQSERRDLFVVAFCAATIMLVGVIVLLGWALDVSLLKSVVPGFPEMKPNTAAGLLVAAIGLVFARQNSRWSIVCGTFVGLLGAVTLTEYVAGSNSGVDTLLLRMFGSVSDHEMAGRMSPHAAFNFFLFGIALISLNGRRFFKELSGFLAILIAMTAFAALLGHLYGAAQFRGVTQYNSMALHTIGLFFLCSTGLLAANRDHWLVTLVASQGIGGSMARRLLPAVILTPTIIGWLGVIGRESELYGTTFGAALAMFACVVLMVGIVLFFSRAVHEVDSRRKNVEHELMEKEERFRELFDYSQGMICIHDLDGVLTTVNPATLRSLEYDISEVVGQSIADFMPFEKRASVDKVLREIRGRGMAKGLLPLVSKSGRELMLSYNSILVSAPGRPPYVIAHAQDVTELVAAQNKLKNLSLTDDLTGLYNRRGFMTMAEQQLKLERHAGTARGLTLMFADMDGLKKINDVYGHEAGSDAIVGLAKIITSSLRGADLIARWGGDEFVILTIGSRNEEADVITERIYRRIGEYNAGSDKPYSLACSIGVSPISFDGTCSFETMIAEADRAMYAEKRRRKTSGEVSAPSRSIWLGDGPSPSL